MAVTTGTSAGADEGLLGLDEAARRVGLHYMTLYRHVRTGRLPAVQRDGRWWVDPADLDRLGSRRPAGRGPGPVRFTDARRRLVGRLLEGDHGGSWAVVEECLAGGAAPADAYRQLLGPALHEVGLRWVAGTVSVEGEHRASAVALRLLGRLSPLLSVRGTPLRGAVVLGGAPGDPHVLPVAMAADLLRSRRLRVVDLGADVPQESLLGAAAAASAAGGLRAVGISLSDRGRARAAASVVRALRRQHPAVPLLVGGPAVPDRQTALDLGADEWAADGLAAADLVLSGPGAA